VPAGRGGENRALVLLLARLREPSFSRGSARDSGRPSLSTSKGATTSTLKEHSLAVPVGSCRELDSWAWNWGASRQGLRATAVARCPSAYASVATGRSVCGWLSHFLWLPLTEVHDVARIHGYGNQLRQLYDVADNGGSAALGTWELRMLEQPPDALVSHVATVKAADLVLEGIEHCGRARLLGLGRRRARAATPAERRCSLPLRARSPSTPARGSSHSQPAVWATSEAQAASGARVSFLDDQRLRSSTSSRPFELRTRAQRSPMSIRVRAPQPAAGHSTSQCPISHSTASS
jgi:hypothetical protein